MSNQFSLPDKWDEDLKLGVTFDSDLVQDIEWYLPSICAAIYQHQEKQFNDDVMSRIQDIQKQADKLSKLLTTSQNQNDTLSLSIDSSLSDRIVFTLRDEWKADPKKFVPRDEAPVRLQRIKNDISSLALAASNTVQELTLARTKKGWHLKPYNQFILSMGSFFEKAGGRFSIKKENGQTGPFWRFLIAMHSQFPKEIQLKEDALRARVVYVKKEEKALLRTLVEKQDE